MIQIYATAIAINGNGIIITGHSGAGKSDLTMRLIDRGAQLIADDQIIINGPVNKPILCQTAHHINAIELRGVGIISMDCVNNVALKLAVILDDNYERSPKPFPLRDYGDYHIPTVKISAWELSAPIKVEMALKEIGDRG